MKSFRSAAIFVITKLFSPQKFPLSIFWDSHFYAADNQEQNNNNSPKPFFVLEVNYFQYMHILDNAFICNQEDLIRCSK